MDLDRTIELLRQPSVALAFDTNALFGISSFPQLCRDLRRVGRAQKSLLTLSISAAAHGEKLFDLKQKWQGSYDYSSIARSLKRLDLGIHEFNESDAMILGELLGTTHPTDQDWWQAKKRHYEQSLGLPEGAGRCSGEHLSATLDWLIAAHAKARGCVLVTSDTGPEFAQVQHVKLAVLQQALAQLLPAAAPLPISQGAP